MTKRHPVIIQTYFCSFLCSVCGIIISQRGECIDIFVWLPVAKFSFGNCWTASHVELIPVWYIDSIVLFNDALDTFYLWLYGVRHMVRDHSDSEKGNPLPPHRLLLSINSKGSFICTIPQTGLHIPRPLLHQSWSTGWNEK